MKMELVRKTKSHNKMQLVGKNNIPKFTTDEKWKIKIGRKVLKGRKMESLFWFDNG
jgi:hypothetical protein